MRLVALWTRAAPEGIMVGTHPVAAGWVPEVGGSEPPAEGIHKDTDGPDQASDRVDNSLTFRAVPLSLRTLA